MTGTEHKSSSPYWLCGLLLALSAAAWSQPQPSNETAPAESIWHVEVLLFAHRPGDIAWREQTRLQDFRPLPVMPAIPVTSEPDTDSEDIEPFASEPMASAWQRMQGRYDLLGYYRWNQLEGIGRRWRIHGEAPLSTDDISADSGSTDSTGTAQSVVSATSDMPSTADSPPQPDAAPQFQYVLDGSLKINTGKVGVAELNVRERSRVLYYRNEDLADGNDDQSGSEDRQIPSDGETPADYRVRALQQKRRIQAGRMEYFDSSGLAALVLISELPVTEDPTANAAEQ